VPERDAAKAVENSDKERANFFRRFYSVREELPTQYDVVLNTDILSINSAAKMVVAATAG
jgi:cytidylate kinase